MLDLKDFILACQECLSKDKGADHIDALIEATMKEPSFLQSLPQPTQEEELLHLSEDLTVVLVRLSPNVHFPPHNHNMPVRVIVTSGTEKHFFYQEKNGTLTQTKEQDFHVGDIVKGKTTAIHSVVNPTATPAAALHLYFGDLIHQERLIWHPESLEAVPYSDDIYFAYAQPLDSSKSFTLPTTCDAHATA